MVTTTTGLATSFINFTRASNATVTNNVGNIAWAGHNLIPDSESFDKWFKYTVTVSANAELAPNNTTTADTVSADGTNDWHYVRATVSAGFARTFSAFVKKKDHDFVQILFGGDVSAWANFNVASGTKGSAGTNQTESITPVGNGWYLISVTTQSLTASDAYIGLIPSATSARAAGGAFSTGVYLWGAHCFRSDLGGMVYNPAQPAGFGTYYPTTPRNLLGFTEDFSNAAWIKGGLLAFGSGSAANATLAPNGLQTADLLIENTSNTQHQAYQAYTFGVSAYTFSVYAKAATGTRVLQLYPSFSVGGAGGGKFDLQTQTATSVAGTSGCTATITHASDGWYRCSIKWTSTAAAGFVFVTTAPSTSSGLNDAYTGDGTSGIYLWGAQLSDSASIDAYSPVYGTAVTSSAYYAPRLDYDPVSVQPRGLLVEEQRTNLLLRSQEFDSASWTKAGLNATGTPPWVNVGIAPDGTLTADKLTENSSSGGHYISQSVTTSSGAHTFTVYAKAAERSQLFLYLGGPNKGVGFDLITGAAFQVGDPLADSYSATSVGNGWWRLSITTNTGAPNSAQLYMMASGTYIYTGDGTSGVLVWGAQLEANASFATSYIPTSASTVTRSADVASVSTQAFPYSQTEGTVVVSSTAFFNNGGLALNITDGSSRIQIASEPSYQFAVVNAALSPTTQASLDGGTPSYTGGINKAAGVYKNNDFALSFNGGAVATDNTGTVPIFTGEMYIGTLGTNSFVQNGHIRQVTYLPRRVPNAELQTRTT